MGTLPRLLSALLAGASGLGLQVLLIAAASRGLGHGRGAALGLFSYLAFWALGAYAAGRWSRRRTRLGLALSGLAVALGSVVATRVLLGMEGGGPAGLVVAVAGLGLVALPQGAFLPLLARGGNVRRVGALFGASLLGAVVGAELFGRWIVAAEGRTFAAACAGAGALAAGLLGALASRDGGTGPEDSTEPARAELARWQAGVCVGLFTAWTASLELACLRLAMMWLGGMQESLSAVLALSLLALSLGAWLLPPLLPRGRRGLPVALALCGLATVWPFFAGEALITARDTGVYARAACLVVPALFPFGAAVPLVYAASGGESGARLGGLLLHEVWGSALFLLVLAWLVLPTFGLSAVLAAWLLAAAPWAWWLGARRPVDALLPAGLLVAGVLAALAPSPVRGAAPLRNPALEVLAFEEDEHFAVSVVDDGLLGERTLLTDGFRAAGTGRAYRYMRALGHLPLLLHPDPRSVGVLALGTGTTVGAVHLHDAPREITVLELSQAVLDQAPYFEAVNRGALAPSERVSAGGRVRVRLGDGRRALLDPATRFDVLTMEPLLPDSPFGVYLYTEEFYAAARGALSEGGLLCQWVPPHALEPVVFDAVVDAFCAGFEWSSLWQFGTQLILVGSDRRPAVGDARFADFGDALAAELADLGLQDRASLLTHYLHEGSTRPRAERPLTDDDPWVLYRERRRGAVLLSDLPRNLAGLWRAAQAPPAEWTADLPGFDARYSVAQTVRRARAGHALLEARRVGVSLPLIETELLGEQSFGELVLQARAVYPEDRELADLVEERAFLEAVRGGVAALQMGDSRQATQKAVSDLVRAAELRGERADVHLYLAVALHRAGSPAAAQAAQRAQDLCPRITETPAGARALELGLPRELLREGRAP